MEMMMTGLAFDRRDAEILYSIPKPPSDLTTIVRYFMFTNRTAPPSYSELADCFEKSLQAGILRQQAERFVVESEWYKRIHKADETAENEIESMLEFEDEFIDREFQRVNEVLFALSEEHYRSVLKGL
jgi:hypothetical protein